MAIQSNFPAIKPSLLLDFANVKQLDPRITFTRASTATFYDGVTTAMAEQNLFLNSQNFGSWSINNATRTTGITDPSGGTTAATITKTANDDWSLRQDPSLNTRSATLTFSAYLKGSGTVIFRADNYVNQALTQTITLTSTWTRYFVTFTFNSTGSTTNAAFGIGMPSGSTATSFDIAFAQIELRSTATAYTATTTQAITNYIPVLQTAASGVARFDHNPTTGESLGLLIEEARTNLVTYSGDFSNAAWTKANTTTLSNSIVAPDGTLTGTTLTSTNSSAGYIYQSTVTTSTTYTQSFYAKAGTATSIRLDFVTGGFAQGASCTYNLSAGTVGSINYYGASSGFTASITPVGNGWYRCSLTGLAPAATWYLELALISNLNNYVFLWGGQWEVGPFATSYIPTVASAVSRATDAAIMTGTNFSSWFNNSEGTLYSDHIASSGSYVFTFSDGDSNNYILTRSSTSSSSFVVAVNNSIQANFGTTALNAKIANAYKTNDFATSVNGASAATDTSGIIPVVNQVRIGASMEGSVPINGTIKKLAYYPIRVTNTQLQALTS